MTPPIQDNAQFRPALDALRARMISAKECRKILHIGEVRMNFMLMEHDAAHPVLAQCTDQGMAVVDIAERFGVPHNNVVAIARSAPASIRAKIKNANRLRTIQVKRAQDKRLSLEIKKVRKEQAAKKAEADIGTEGCVLPTSVELRSLRSHGVPRYDNHQGA